MERLDDCIRDGVIDFDTLYQLSDGRSMNEKALCRLAHELYNGRGNITISQLFRDLDVESMQIALEALRLRYFG